MISNVLICMSEWLFVVHGWLAIPTTPPRPGSVPVVSSVTMHAIVIVVTRRVRVNK